VSGAGILPRIRKIAEEVAEREGCVLYDIEFIGAGVGRTLRIYIDKNPNHIANSTPDSPAESAVTQEVEADELADEIVEKAGVGVSVADCSNVSKGLNLLLDVEDVIPGGAYNLEVSSPGLERVLKQDWHFRKVLGKKVAVRAFAPLMDFNPRAPGLGKAKQITGELLSVDEKGIKVQGDVLGEIFVPFETITKANLVFDYVGSQESGKKGKR
jgi:ribosome maturation factor RimP